MSVIVAKRAGGGSPVGSNYQFLYYSDAVATGCSDLVYVPGTGYIGAGINPTNTQLEVANDFAITNTTSNRYAKLTKGTSGDIGQQSNVVLQYDDYTMFLLQSESYDGDATLIDSSPREHIIVNYYADHSTDQAKFGSTSVDAGFAEMQPSDDWAFGTGDFTIRFWVYVSTSHAGVIWDSGTTNPGGILVYLNGRRMQISFSGGGIAEGSDNSLDTWQHYEISRASGTVKIFRDGVETASSALMSGYDVVGTFDIGLFRIHGTATWPLVGYVEELRVDKGIARHTAGFTPPTTPEMEDTDKEYNIWSSDSDGITFGDSDIVATLTGVKFNFQPGTDTEQFFGIKDSAGTSIVNVDTLQNYVGFNRLYPKSDIHIGDGGDLRITTEVSSTDCDSIIFNATTYNRQIRTDFKATGGSLPTHSIYSFYGDTINTWLFVSAYEPYTAGAYQLGMHIRAATYAQISTTSQVTGQNALALYFGGDYGSTAAAHAVFDLPNGKFGFGELSPATKMHVGGALTLNELGSDPSDPAEGKFVVWKGTGAGTGDDGDILYKEQSASVVTQASLKWKDMVPESITVNASDGTTGSVSDVKTMLDGNYYQIEELAATPGFDVEFNFTSVDRYPQMLVLRYLYNGLSTHYITVGVYNYNTTIWDQFHFISDTNGYYRNDTKKIPLNIMDDYVDGSGNAKVRLYHATAGNTAHYFRLDYIGLTHALQGVI